MLQRSETFSMMKTVFALLLIVLPASDAMRTESLDRVCGATVSLQGEGKSVSHHYLILNDLHGLCKVHFYAGHAHRAQITITGNRMDHVGCSVDVYTKFNKPDKTYSAISSPGYFSRTLTSSELGSLYLRVEGPECAHDTYGLRFEVKAVCPPDTPFECASGMCIHSSDVCDGVNNCGDLSDEEVCSTTPSPIESTTYVFYGKDELLDRFCGEEVVVQYPAHHRRFIIRSNSSFTSLCRINFHTVLSRRVQLTITGNRLDAAGCSVNVFDGSDIYSKTGGNVTSRGPFSRTVKAGYLGFVYLHVQGPRCADDVYSLAFMTSTFCPSYNPEQCDSGQCRRSKDVCNGYQDCLDGSDERNCGGGLTSGQAAGVAVGVVFFVLLAVLFGVLCYRRRVLYLGRPPLLTSPDQNSGSSPVVAVLTKW